MPSHAILFCATLPFFTGVNRFDFSSAQAGTQNEEITIPLTDKHYCSNCTVYIAVYGFRCLYELVRDRCHAAAACTVLFCAVLCYCILVYAVSLHVVQSHVMLH